MAPSARAPSPRSVYRSLLKRFGPQGWWPVTPRGALRPRYRPGPPPRLSEAQRFEICAGAILTQNTAWSNVEKALESLHRSEALSSRAIASMPGARLEGLVRSSGYFVQKARKLKIFARRVLKERSLGGWLRGDLPSRREALLSLWGVGPETADSMLLYAAGSPVFVVDAYTRRLGERLGWLKPSWSYERVRGYFESRLPESVPVYQEFHALIVALGKSFCRKRPLCAPCPLRARCRHGRETLRSEAPS